MHSPEHLFVGRNTAALVRLVPYRFFARRKLPTATKVRLPRLDRENRNLLNDASQGDGTRVQATGRLRYWRDPLRAFSAPLRLALYVAVHCTCLKYRKISDKVTECEVERLQWRNREVGYIHNCTRDTLYI